MVQKNFDSLKNSLVEEGAKSPVVSAILGLVQEFDSKRWILRALLSEFPESSKIVDELLKF